MKGRKIEIKGLKLEDERIQYTVKGIIVGIAAGFTVSMLRLAVEYILELTVSVYGQLNKNPVWIPVWVIFSAAVALFVGFIVKGEPHIKGSGIPQVEGQLLGIISIRWWSVLWKKFIGGLFSIGSGLFLGREGPSIQIGAVSGQGVSRLLKGDQEQEKVLVSCGASAGLAAAFNAPIAGLMFIFEEVYHCFSPLVALASFFASVTANFISMNIFGLKPALDVGSISTFPVKYYGYLVLLGAILGFSGLLYQKVLLMLPKIYGKIKFIPQHFYGIIPFLLVIPIGLFVPETLGGGSGLVLSVAQSLPAVRVLIFLFIIRFVFSMISYGGNLPGGIFLPILTLGAILGAVYGALTVNLTGMDAALIRNFIIFAMAGYFTSISKAPLTGIILVAEMVGSVNQMMPLAVVSFSAFIVADLAGAQPIYEALLERMTEKKNPESRGCEVEISREAVNSSPTIGINR